MTVRYIASTGSNTSPYDTWAKAATDPATVIALMGAGDISYIKNETFTIAVDTTYTFAGTLANPCMLISTSDTVNNPPTSVATGASIDGSATAGVDITVNGKVYIYGVTFKAGTGTAAVSIAQTDDSIISLENCALILTSATSGGIINIGTSAGTNNNRTITRNCTFTFGTHASQTIAANNWNDIGSTFTAGTAPTTFLNNVGSALGNECRFHGSNINALTNTTLVGATSSKPFRAIFSQCKLPTGYAAISASITGPAHTEVLIYDSASGDTHYEFGHYDYWGNTTISTAICLNTTSGAAYDVAGNKHSWKIVGTNATYQTPYISPWISVYNESLSAVTPRLEILRDGSATAYNDDEVWADFSAKTTSGFPIASVVTDKRGLVAAAAAQSDSTLGAGDWGGEGGTAWFGKLEPTSSITPAEIGFIQARVCVAGANTVYVNPRILGTTVPTANLSRVMPYDFMNVETAAGGSGGLLTHPGMSGGMRG